MAKILLVLSCPTFRAKVVHELMDSVRSYQSMNCTNGGVPRVFGDSRGTEFPQSKRGPEEIDPFNANLNVLKINNHIFQHF